MTEFRESKGAEWLEGGGKSVIVQFTLRPGLMNCFHFSLHLIPTAFLQSSCHLHPNYFRKEETRCSESAMQRK